MERRRKYVSTIHKIAAKQVWLGAVEAVGEAEAIKAEEFKAAANRSFAIRRR